MRKLKNITVTLEPEVARWARVQAAEKNISVSRFLGNVLAERMRQRLEYQAAMESYLALKPVPLGKGQKYPRREELHDRQLLR